jgi:hypothetical protein
MIEESRKIQETLEKPAFYDKENVLYIMVKTRACLEKTKKSGKYQTLNFYCTWLVHSQLTKGKSCSILKTIFEKPDRKDTNQHISNSLDIKKLHSELIEFYKFLNIEIKKIKNIKKWKKFSSNILVEIIDKPLLCNKKEPICTMEAYSDYNGIKIIDHEGVIHWELLSPELDKVGSRVIGILPVQK